jgi:hypothetical protein
MASKYCAMVFGLLMSAAFAASGADFKHENKPQNLKALFELVHHTLHVKQDKKQAAALFNTLIPDEARAKKALKDNIAPDALRQILDMHKMLGSMTEEGIIKAVAGPSQKAAEVYAATTEEIMRFTEDSVAFKDFPGGARRAAKQVLRPATTFYAVYYVERGKKAMQYHLIYWDGKQWSMLGPVWRVLKR